MSREKQNLLSAILKINRLDTSKKDKLIETNSLLLQIKKIVCIVTTVQNISVMRMRMQAVQCELSDSKLYLDLNSKNRRLYLSTAGPYIFSVYRTKKITSLNQHNH